MSTAPKHTAKLSKGQRLNWPPVKDSATLKLSDVAIKSREIPPIDIKCRQQHSSGGNLTLLVP
jgi:hypothetical protein